MPGERHVFDPLFAGVIDQRERQTIRVRATEFVNSRTLTLFRNRPRPAGFLSCEGVTRDRVIAPDLSLGLGTDDVECSIRIDRPNGAERVGPCASQSGRTGTGSGRAASNESDEGARENKSEKALDFHGAYAASKQFNASSSDHRAGCKE
jgi:hypothetical protein